MPGQHLRQAQRTLDDRTELFADLHVGNEPRGRTAHRLGGVTGIDPFQVLVRVMRPLAALVLPRLGGLLAIRVPKVQEAERGRGAVLVLPAHPM